MFRKVIIGGTFDLLHGGHKKILKTAFKIGEKVIIGLTSDEFASRFRIGKVSPYEKRRTALKNFIKKFKKSFEIIKIHDNYGIATLDPEVDCIVVSEETLLRAEEINAIRFKKGLEKLVIVVIPIILAENGKPISSDRILAKEIDSEGKVLK